MISHGRLEKRVRLTNFVLFRRSPSSPPAQPPKGVRSRADDGDRTRDPQLGKLMLYQLSYVRAGQMTTQSERATFARPRLQARSPDATACGGDRTLPQPLHGSLHAQAARGSAVALQARQQ